MDSDAYPLVGNIRLLLPNLVLTDLSCCVFVIATNWRHIAWNHVLCLAPAMTAVIPLGNYILMNNPPDLLEKCVGFFFLFYATFQIISGNVSFKGSKGQEAEVVEVASPQNMVGGQGHEAVLPAIIITTDDYTINTSDGDEIGEGEKRGKCGNSDCSTFLKDTLCSKYGAMGLAAGTISGILGGIYGLFGPPTIMFFSLIVISKEALRATSMMISIINSPVQIVSGVYNHIWRMDCLLVYIAVPFFAILGTSLGSILHDKVCRCGSFCFSVLFSTFFCLDY